VADVGWITCGLAAEISAFISESALKYLKSPVRRVALPDAPAPASPALEKNYYPDYLNIIKAVKEAMKK